MAKTLSRGFRSHHSVGSKSPTPSVPALRAHTHPRMRPRRGLSSEDTQAGCVSLPHVFTLLLTMAP